MIRSTETRQSVIDEARTACGARGKNFCGKLFGAVSRLLLFCLFFNSAAERGRVRWNRGEQTRRERRSRGVTERGEKNGLGAEAVC